MAGSTDFGFDSGGSGSPDDLASIERANTVIENSLDDILDQTNTSIDDARRALSDGRALVDEATKTSVESALDHVENVKRFAESVAALFPVGGIAPIGQAGATIGQARAQIAAQQAALGIAANPAIARIGRQLDIVADDIAEIERGRVECLEGSKLPIDSEGYCSISDYDSIYGESYTSYIADASRLISELANTPMEGIITNVQPQPIRDDFQKLLVSSRSTERDLVRNVPRVSTPGIPQFQGFLPESAPEPSLTEPPQPQPPQPQPAPATSQPVESGDVESVVSGLLERLSQNTGPQVTSGQKWSVYCNKTSNLVAIYEDGRPTGDGWELVGGFKTQVDAERAALSGCPDAKAIQFSQYKRAEVQGFGVLCGAEAYNNLASVKASDFKLGGSITDILGLADESTSTLKIVTGTLANPLDVIRAGAADTWLSKFIEPLYEGLQKLLATQGCFSTKNSAALVGRLVFGFLERWIGPVFGDAELALRYISHNECPIAFPSGEQATTAFLGGTIDEDTWASWQRINNNCVEPQERVLQAVRSKLPANENARLYLRKQITKEEYDNRIRKLGFIDGSTPDEVLKLAVQLPGQSDLIRFMIRDVADEENIDWTQVDADFKSKYVGPLKEYFEQQGVPEQVAKFAWRASKRLPSPEQYYRMLHRLNFDDTPEKVKTTPAQVIQGLKRDDYANEWIDRLMAVSHRVLSVRDTRNMFRLGVLSKDEVKRKFMEMGFSETDAKFHTKFAESEAIRRLGSGPLARAVIQGVGSAKDLNESLEDSSLDKAGRDKVLSNVRKLAKARRTVACNKLLKVRFLDGDITEDEARQQLRKTIEDNAIAEEIIEGWKCEKEAQGRAMPMGKAIELFKAGAINKNELEARFIGLGFDAGDAALMADEQQRQLDLIVGREIEKAVKERERARAKVAKDAEADRKKADRRAANAERARKAANAAVLRRQKQMANIANSLTKVLNLDPDAAFDLGADTIDQLRADDGLTLQGATDVVEKATKNPRLADGGNLLEIAKAIS